MDFTVEQIEAHIAHYHTYRELPMEVMTQLFASAMALAMLTKTKGDVLAAISEVDTKIEVIDAKPKRAAKTKAE